VHGKHAFFVSNLKYRKWKLLAIVLRWWSLLIFEILTKRW
jgi:hypothetical protein